MTKFTDIRERLGSGLEELGPLVLATKDGDAFFSYVHLVGRSGYLSSGRRSEALARLVASGLTPERNAIVANAAVELRNFYMYPSSLREDWKYKFEMELPTAYVNRLIPATAKTCWLGGWLRNEGGKLVVPKKDADWLMAKVVAKRAGVPLVERASRHYAAVEEAKMEERQMAYDFLIKALGDNS